MRKLVASVIVSLDGVVESPEQWAFAYTNDEIQQVNQAGMAASDALLFGRVTYQMFAAYWPTATDEPYASHINTTPKYVVSTTLDTLAWGTWDTPMLIQGNLMDEITKLKHQPGKDITTIGSATLVQSLLHHNLLDELRLLVHPVVIGRGNRLFSDGNQQALELVNVQPFRTGVVALTYQPGTHQA